MREIKFRAWWADVKEMRYFENPVIIMDDKDRYGIFIPSTTTVFMGHSELMQYTGLKDKNGKEIYEGDVIKRTDDSLRLVKWSMFGFQLFSVQLPDSYWNSDYLDWQQSEVIGNIYENKELLM